MGKKVNIEISSLFEYQSDIAKDIIKSDDIFFTIVASRQSGKSILISRLAVYFALSKPKEVILIVLPTAKHIKYIRPIYREIVQNISFLIKPYRDLERSIEFINGSRIIFESSKTQGVGRGLSNRYIIIDEAAFCGNVVEENILPTMSARKNAKIIMASTPYGKNNEFFKYFDKGRNREECKNPTKDCKSYRMHYTQNETRNQKLIDLCKLTFSTHKWLTEFEASFEVAESQVFKDFGKVSTLQSFPFFIAGKIYYAGIDWGMVSDKTVLTIIDTDGKIVLIKEFTGDIEQQVKDILSVLNIYKPITYAETNGIGLPLYQALNKHYYIKPHITSISSKTECIESLIYSINTNSIQLPIYQLAPKLHNEMFEYMHIKTKSGQSTYTHPTGGHDDYIDSLSIANYYMRKQSGSNPIDIISSSTFSKPADLLGYYDLDDDF